jgi:hypothetical protein
MAPGHKKGFKKHLEAEIKQPQLCHNHKMVLDSYYIKLHKLLMIKALSVNDELRDVLEIKIFI